MDRSPRLITFRKLLPSLCIVTRARSGGNAAAQLQRAGRHLALCFGERRVQAGAARWW
jgi:hypothetical protein